MVVNNTLFSDQKADLKTQSNANLDTDVTNTSANGNWMLKYTISPIRTDSDTKKQLKKPVNKLNHSPDDRQTVSKFPKPNPKLDKSLDSKIQDLVTSTRNNKNYKSVEVAYVRAPNLGVKSIKREIQKERKFKQPTQLQGAYKIKSIMSGFRSDLKPKSLKSSVKRKISYLSNSNTSGEVTYNNISFQSEPYVNIEIDASRNTISES
jgi:hypothetical protein